MTSIESAHVFPQSSIRSISGLADFVGIFVQIGESGPLVWMHIRDTYQSILIIKIIAVRLVSTRDVFDVSEAKYFQICRFLSFSVGFYDEERILSIFLRSSSMCPVSLKKIIMGLGRVLEHFNKDRNDTLQEYNVRRRCGQHGSRP